MWEEIASDSESLTVVCLSLVGIVAILVFGICGTVVSLVKVSTHARLKQRMLELGMSPSEIEQVLKAGSENFKAKWHQNRKPPALADDVRSARPSKAQL